MKGLFTIKPRALKDVLYLADADAARRLTDRLLLSDAIKILPDGQLAMWCVGCENPIIRSFPLVIAYEEIYDREELTLLVHEDSSGELLYPDISVKPLDDAISVINGVANPGKLTFHPSSGRCYPKDLKTSKASMVTTELPKGFDFGTSTPELMQKGWALTTSGGIQFYAPFNTAVWLQDSEGNVSIADLADVQQFDILDESGLPFAPLVDYLQYGIIY